MSTMTFERFDELASAYGATIAQWPVEEQAAAETFAATSADAQAVLNREQALDAAMDAWEAPAPSDALMARILGDAAEVGATAPVAEAATPTPVQKAGLFSRLFGDMGWRPAGALAACLAIAVVATQMGPQSTTDAPNLLTDEQLALQVEDEEILTAFFDESFFDDDELFEADAEFL